MSAKKKPEKKVAKKKLLKATFVYAAKRNAQMSVTFVYYNTKVSFRKVKKIPLLPSVGTVYAVSYKGYDLDGVVSEVNDKAKVVRVLLSPIPDKNGNVIL